MADVVGVVFQDGNKTYHFDSAGLELARGDRVIVQTSKGSEIGQVVEPTHHVDDSELAASLKKVVRVATGEDLEAQACSQCVRKEAMATCREMIAAHGLDMKLVSADISFGGERITFNFYSDERVDFRSLVADLSKALKMRVELRQVGAREEARMVGGLGPCGRHLCCTLFPGDDEPVSIRMAKEQNLPLNPVKISGLCGRLMCCLKYEQQQYVSFRKEAPPRGTKVITPAGESVITGFNVPKDSITVRLEDGSYADLRLEDCEAQEDGTLVFTPREEEEPAQKPGEYRVLDFSLIPTDDDEDELLEARAAAGAPPPAWSVRRSRRTAAPAVTARRVRTASRGALAPEGAVDGAGEASLATAVPVTARAPQQAAARRTRRLPNRAGSSPAGVRPSGRKAARAKAVPESSRPAASASRGGGADRVGPAEATAAREPGAALAAPETVAEARAVAGARASSTGRQRANLLVRRAPTF